MIAETLEALNEARENAGAGASEQEVLFGGIEAELEKLAASMTEAAPQNGEGWEVLRKRLSKSNKMLQEQPKS